MFSCLRLFIALQFPCFCLQSIYIPSVSLHCYCFISCSGSSGGYSYSSSAFIFSLINKEGLAPFKSMVKIPKYAIYKVRSFGPIFGGGNDILISDNANINICSYTNFNGRYYSVPSRVHNSRTILAGSYYFTPDEVEVFYLVWVTCHRDRLISNRLKQHF